jgi:hypothetical protein
MRVDPAATYRLLEAVEELYRQHAKLQEMRRNVKPCTEFSSGDRETGDYGTPACDIHKDTDEMCENCLIKAAQLSAFKVAKRKRALAQRRILRWAERHVKTPYERETWRYSLACWKKVAGK